VNESEREEQGDRLEQVLAESSPNWEEEPIPESLPEPAMLGWVELIYGTLVHPAGVFRQVAEGREWSRGLLLFGLIQAATWFLQMMLVAGTLPATKLFPTIAPSPGAILQTGQVLLLATTMTVVSFLLLLVGAGLYALLAELLGGQGGSRGLLTALALCSLPTLFGVPLQVLVVLLPATAGLEMLLSLGLGLWVMGLQILAIREVEGFTTGKAILLYLLPWLVLAGGLMLLLASAVMVLQPLLT